MLWKNLGLVKGVGFDSSRRVGAVLPAIKVYNTREVDELVLLDITATVEDREPDYESISEFSAECFVPLAVGGGVRNIAQIKNLLQAGADKIVINTATYEQSGLIDEASGRYGSQCVVVSIDARRMPSGKYECFSHCGARATGQDPVEWARQAESLGAGEILITSIDRDGSMGGYDLELTRLVVEAVQIPVIASGGAGSFEHLYEAIKIGRASAVAAASMFHFTEQTPRDAKEYLAARDIPTRESRVELHAR